MSDETPPPFPPFGPFGDPSFFASLMGTPSDGPLNYGVAEQIASWLAVQGLPQGGEPNVDPQLRMRIDDLARVAQMHVQQATGLGVDAVPIRVLSVTSTEWGKRALRTFGPLLEQLGGALSGSIEEDNPMFSAPQLEDGTDPMAMFAQMLPALQPVLLGMQAGFLVGNLSRETLGQYDIPLPWKTPANELGLVASRIESFAKEWSLEIDETLMYLLVREMVLHSVLTQPHVSRRIDSLLSTYVGGFKPNSEALEERLGHIDMSDMSAINDIDIDPRELLGAMSTAEQRPTQDALHAVLAAVNGYADYMVNEITAQLTPNAGAIAGALARRRVSDTEASKFVRELLGLELDTNQYERGKNFVDGVIERAGKTGLSRLWMSERELPTPAEIEAPGLWLARIDLPDV